MEALRSALLTGAAHSLRILIGFVLLKLIAFYMGPAGLGSLGHFMSAVTIWAVIGGGGITNALIKYTSEYKRQPRILLVFLNSALSYSFIICLCVFLLVSAFSRELSLFIFKREDYFLVIVFLAFSQFGLAFVNFVNGVSSGLSLVSVYSRVQILGCLLAFPVIWYLVSRHGLIGAAFALLSVYLMAVFPAGYFFFKSTFWRRIKFSRLNRGDVSKLSSFTLMVLVSAISFPLVEILVREMLIRDGGYVSAGIWQGSIKLASAYLGFFNVFLAYYFMPKISVCEDKSVIARRTYETLLYVMFIFLLGASTLYLWRDFFVPLILSDEFSSLEDFILYQLLGDFFKISSYVICFVVVAKAATRLYVSAEIFQNLLFLILIGVMSSGAVNIEGVMKAYSLTYFVFFLVCLASFFIYTKSNGLNRSGLQ